MSDYSMVDGGERPNQGARLGLKSHENLLELCALATTDNLTEEEQKTLRNHLAICAGCREAMKQFEVVVDRTIPTLAAALAGETPEVDCLWSREKAEVAFFKRLSSKGNAKAVP